MNTWIEAAKKRMRDMGITQSVLAERLGVTQGAVAHWLSGRRSPDIPTLERILKVLDLAPLGIRLVAVDDAFDGQSNVAPMLQPSRKPRSYPLISWVAAGERAESPDIFAPGQGEEMIESTENAGENGYWLTVKGKSMVSDGYPSFPPGMAILIRPEGFELVSGKFYVAKHRDGETTFKQYIYDAGTRYLSPLNPAYKLIEMDDDWAIIGRVVDAKLIGL